MKKKTAETRTATARYEGFVIERMKAASESYFDVLMRAGFHGTSKEFEDALTEGKSCFHKLIMALAVGIQSGHRAAANELVELVEYAIWILNTRKDVGQSELINEIAGIRTFWPVNLARHKDKIAEAEIFLRDIGLGSKTSVGYENQKSFGWKGETAVSIELYLQLFNWQNDPKTRALYTSSGDAELTWHKLAASLPPLSRDKNVLKLWWRAVDAAFVHMYEEHFEDRTQFERYWQDSSVKQLPEHSRRAVVRRNIKKAIKQGLRSIAPQS